MPAWRGEYGQQDDNFFQASEGKKTYGKSVAKNDEEAMDLIVDSIYKRTQESLAEAGIKELELLRGTQAMKESDHPQGTVAKKVVSNPLESFTTKPRTAAMFSRGKEQGVVLSEVIPAERIFSCHHTGCGTDWEFEFCVIGNDHDKAFIHKLGK